MVNSYGDPGQQHWHKAHAEFGRMLREAFRVEEGPDEDEPRSVDERLIQCIWIEQFFDAAKLQTQSGKAVEILSPGRWNTGPGPDFFDAEISIAGTKLSGDIEIHLRSNGWTQHGHHQDFEYNGVILHVCLDPSDDRPFEEKQNGERLERLVVRDALEPDLDTLLRTINIADYPLGRIDSFGKCHPQFVDYPDRELGDFLRAAGRARIEDKVERFAQQRASASMEQLIYQSMMTAQGYKANKTLYFLLSKRVPVAELFDFANDIDPERRSDLFLSALMHVAQLMPEQLGLVDDPDTEAFSHRLIECWKNLRPYFSDRLMPPTKRWHSGMRPAGFPGRRLAAVALLLGRLADHHRPLFRFFEDTIRGMPTDQMNPKEWKQFFADMTKELIVQEPNHYFTTHYSLGGKTCRPQALLGEPAARSMVFNVILPLVVLSARENEDEMLEQKAWSVVSHFPSLPKNSISKLMRIRLFGETGRDKGLFRTEVTHQALLKVFYDCCSTNERSCESCTFLNPPYTP